MKKLKALWGIALSLMLLLPNLSFALSFTLTGSGTQTTFIAGNYAAEGFRIDNVSSLNRARLYFQEGNINKLILTGVNLIATQYLENATIEFEHMFQTANDAGIRNSFIDYTGGGNFFFPSPEDRVFSGTGEWAFCSSPNVASCSSTTSFDTLQGVIPAPRSFGIFGPSPDSDDLGSPSAPSYTYLKGRISIGPLFAGERAAVQTLTIMEGFSSPPIDGSDCDGAEAGDPVDLDDDGVPDATCGDRGFGEFDEGSLQAGGPDNSFEGFCEGTPTECQSPAPVPEPSTMLLMGTGLAALLLGKRWRKERNPI